MYPTSIDKELLSSLPLVQRNIEQADKSLIEKIVGADYAVETQHYPFHLLVYLDTTVPIPIITISGLQPTTADRQSFKELLLQLSLVNYDSLLYLTTIYPIFIRRPHNMPDATIKIPHPEMDEFLSNSFGSLLFAHQLEQLYCMITGCNYLEAITFRKDWNLKRPKARERATSLFLSKGISLAELIRQRSVEENQFVYNANFGGAYRLWSYLIQKPSI